MVEIRVELVQLAPPQKYWKLLLQIGKLKYQLRQQLTSGTITGIKLVMSQVIP